jgi:hypothetical protein
MAPARLPGQPQIGTVCRIWQNMLMRSMIVRLAVWERTQGDVGLATRVFDKGTAPPWSAELLYKETEI